MALARSDAGFIVSFDPAGESFASDTGAASEAGGSVTGAANWLELLANGLTFDLLGLAPGPAAQAPPREHEFGLPQGFPAAQMEAITLRPGPHLAAGAAMQPVVRSLAWVAAQLTGLPGVRAVAWHSARSWCSPTHYRDSVLRWIEGGVFPGLGLAALAPTPDGGLQSQGLALFTGQEVRLEPELLQDRAAGAKIGLRLMHWMVENGRVDDTELIPCPDGQPLRLEPAVNGRIVRVWRG